jgi:hypothetical protein
MRQRALLLLPLLIVAAGCSERQDLTGVPEPPQFNEQAASIPKVEEPVYWRFSEVNPCTGLDHIHTWIGTAWVQEHPNNRTVRVRATITTSDGYVGQFVRTWTGSDIFGPGDVSNLTTNGVLTHPSGSTIRWHLVWIADKKTEPMTVRVDEFTAACVRP